MALRYSALNSRPPLYFVREVLVALSVLHFSPGCFRLLGSPHALGAWVGELTANVFKACAKQRGLDEDQVSFTTRSHPLPLTATEVIRKPVSFCCAAIFRRLEVIGWSTAASQPE